MSISKRIIAFLLLSLIGMGAASASSLADRVRAWALGDRVVTAASLDARVATRFDRSAQQCMGCHDGSRASHVTLKGAEAPMQFVGYMNVNHPVGMAYATYASRSPGAYVPSAALAPSVELVEGTVSCVSCHETRASTPSHQSPGLMKVGLTNIADQQNVCLSTGRLTAGPRITDLCLACHIK